MSEFTKEELEKILLWGTDVVESMGITQFYTQGHGAVCDKIESMINDNEANVIHVWHCEKCGHLQS